MLVFRAIRREMVQRPLITAGIVAIFSISAIVYFGIRLYGTDFSDPQVGFETRDTTIANRIAAWKGLISAIESRKLLNFPSVPPVTSAIKLQPEQQFNLTTPHSVIEDKEKISTKKPKLKKQFKKSKNDKKYQDRSLFCGYPGTGYAHFVVKTSDSTNVLRLDNLKALCNLEFDIMKLSTASTVCEYKRNTPECCNAWTLANYVALLNKKRSCHDITENDINNFTETLSDCYPYVSQLNSNCYDAPSKCNPIIPAKCIRHNIVYYVFNYMLDNEFLQKFNKIKFSTISMVYLPVAQSTTIEEFFSDFQKNTANNKKLKIEAVNFGLKEVLFEKYLKSDGILVMLSGICIVLCIWCYTESLIITVSVVFMIISSLGISYMIYRDVFGLEFFPFMNLLSVIISLGIGADDAFIFYKYWENIEMVSLDARLRSTFKYAIKAIFLTTFTTASSFYSTLCSPITAIRCYSIFAGTVVVVNFFLTLLWLPCIFVIREKFIRQYENFQYLTLIRSEINYRFNWVKNGIIWLVSRYADYLIAVLTLVAVLASVVVWWYPQFKLPTSRQFQLFSSSHPTELYDFYYRDKFQAGHYDLESIQMPMYFVWGVKPVDTGDYLNPYSHGPILYDTKFNVCEPDAQRWLLNFCKNIKKQSFYQFEHGPQLLNCFMENFVNWMGKRCIDPVSKQDHSPCCNSVSFPYNSNVFNQCVIQYMNELRETPRQFFGSFVAGPKFSDSSNTIRAVIFEFSSNYTYTLNYYQMKAFYEAVEKFLQNELIDAPDSVRNGWFVSDLEFFDLQRALLEGSAFTVALSIILAFLILFLVTQTLCVSIYATLCIVAIVHVTMAILVLLGWQLNILEAIAVTSSIGLSIDFSLHYSSAYLNQVTLNRRLAVERTLRHAIDPSTMACITTILAGVFMIPSQVQAYIQIGTFLVVVMSVSWIYSTFYFMPMLYLFGINNSSAYHVVRHCCVVIYEDYCVPLADPAFNQQPQVSYPGEVPLSVPINSPNLDVLEQQPISILYSSNYLTFRSLSHSRTRSLPTLELI